MTSSVTARPVVSRYPTTRAGGLLVALLGLVVLSSAITGFRPDLSWLDVPAFNRKGQLIHNGGVTAWPGLYVIGMPFLRRRKSSLIDGAAADARDLTAHLARYLASPSRRPADPAITGRGLSACS